MIEFRRVSKVYHTGTHALKDVSFKIVDGEFVFIIGRSGAGKSTLIKLLTCEEKPSEGSVLIDDFDISRIRRSLVPYLRRNIGMIFQDFRLIYTKTVYENVAFAMEIIGASRRSIQRRVPIVLSIVGLKDRANARPGELSGGEQQRVAIARAMVNNPMLILADEPTGNLDPVNSESVMALLEEINRSGTTVIICTHDRELVDRMKKRVVEISDGLLVRDDCVGSYANCAFASPAPTEFIESEVIENEFGQIDSLRSGYDDNVSDDNLNNDSVNDESVVDELKDDTGNIAFAAEASVDDWNDDNTEELEHEPHSEAYSELLQALRSFEYTPSESDAETESHQQASEHEDGQTRRVSREQRLARALRKYREQGHDVYLPGNVKNEEQHEVVVPDKDDLLELSHNKNSDEAIS